LLDTPAESWFVYGSLLRINESSVPTIEGSIVLAVTGQSDIHQAALITDRGSLVFRHELRVPYCTSQTTGIFAPTFGVTINHDEKLFRRVQPSGVLSCLGYPPGSICHKERAKFISFMPAMGVLHRVYFALMDVVLFPVLDKVLRHMPHSDDLQDCFAVEIEEDTKWDSSLKPSLTYALPSHSEWKAAIASDHDVSLCLDCLKDANQDIMKQPWLDNHYRTLIKDKALDQEDIILFYTAFSQKQALLRTVRFRVVPLKLHPVLFAAYHASAGKCCASFKASFWKLRLRFYWPNVYADIIRACDQCDHCALANSTKHTVEWTTLPCDRPFDVLFTNVWSPGAIPSRNGDCKGLKVMEGMSGFIIGAPLAVVDSTTVAQYM
jgi:hypothetical protein